MNDQRGICELCGNTGFVVVPYLATKDGEIIPFGDRGYTAAATCKCGLGVVVFNNEPKRTTLAQYEGINPDWQAQMDAKDGRKPRQRKAG